MLRIAACLCLLFFAGQAWSAGAASTVDLPELPFTVEEIEAEGHLHIALPADHATAVSMVSRWNAIHGVRDRADVIPTLESLYGEDSAVSQWYRQEGFKHYGKRGDLRQAAVYDFYTSPAFTNNLFLKAPDADLKARIQTFVTYEWLALGHKGPVLDPAAAVNQGMSVTRAFGQVAGNTGLAQIGVGNYIMIGVGLLLLYLGIVKGFEPLLLVTIGMGCVLVNAVGAGLGNLPGSETPGLFGFFYVYGIKTGIFPLLIFLGVGALTDFGPLLANPWSAMLGGAAQFGIFGSFFLAAICGFFTPQEAGAIAIIGGADGPTSIFVAARLAPHLLGAIAVAAYSYMALVPIIQPPVMNALTTDEEKKIVMTQAKPVSQAAKIVFPIAVILLCILLLPDAVPLIGMLMFGNLLRECGVTERLVKASQNEIINITTICLGLAVGSQLLADQFLNFKTIGILVLGCVAFVFGTAAGVLLGKAMCKMTNGKINPLIGAAGVSAVPMAARVVQNVGQQHNRRNFLLMHAMGPNVAGVIGSAVAAGILLALLG